MFSNLHYYHKWKSFYIDSFCSDVANSVLGSSSFYSIHSTTTSLFDLYKSTLTMLIDNHAPIFQRTARKRLSPQWFNSSLIAAIRKRRRLERLWRKTRSKWDRQNFVNECNISSREWLMNQRRITTSRASIQAGILLVNYGKSSMYFLVINVNLLCLLLIRSP